MNKYIALIPYYNHPDTIAKVVHHLLSQSLPCLIIDDGSNEAGLKALEPLKAIDQVTIMYREQNGGKGAAVKTGLEKAQALGYTHAIQVDADAQHNLQDLKTFIQYADQHPDALILGHPQYDHTAPKSRLYGRKITNFWVAINTCSLDIKDAMCGFRLYPLSLIKRLNLAKIGDRMEFDIEILIKLHWEKATFIWVPTQVTYEENGVSHFKALKDNLLISSMHARLFFTMLARLITGKGV
ncbi:glycosyltransferase family 2 protein [Basilea psittacipulmonis]|uniref:Glycosyl transferase n=1 Tax=Basilea psittacipulmonis DSM 24701 TaxID=1072685 RepID=A0A077DEV5_9BURK|nr:glycosyltransferase family 2 protein [Basilea psittacipulmonis]AIL33264.1 glycosyl transferase [Basilea psittacipulmonis DSM 24701]